MQEAGGLSPGGDRPQVSLLGLFGALPAPLLRQALTHPHSVEERSESYERLEFLGDSVLGLAVAALLYRMLPHATEGRLSKVKAFVVSRPSCTQVAQDLGLGDLILQASPVDEEHRRDMVENPTLLGNVLEALIGASFLAFGFSPVAEAVGEAFAGRVAYALQYTVDYKSALQESLAKEGRKAKYTVAEEEGPPHRRTFTSVVTIAGTEYGRGTGGSIKESEQVAAREALARLGVRPDEDDEDTPWLS